jgi:hypothetical protein
MIGIDGSARMPSAITGPAAWTGDAMRARRDWLVALSEAEIGEIAQAVAHADRLGRALIDVDRDAFPLPTLAPRLRALRAEILRGRGFVQLRGLPVANWSRRQLATAYWGIGAHLGRAVSQNAKGHVLGHVRDLGLSPEDPNARIYQTTARQNFHTDSCDIVGLLCLQTARSGGLSCLVSSATVFNRMLATRPDLVAALMEPVCIDRRGEKHADGKGWWRAAVFNLREGELTTIYTRRYIESAQRFPEVPRLSDGYRAALDLFDATCEEPDVRLDIEFLPGDMQFLCNHVVLHDRTAYEDWPEPERKRHLLRLWICPPDGRVLPPEFASRYGSVEIGNRGGIVAPGMKLVAPLEPV